MISISVSFPSFQWDFSHLFLGESRSAEEESKDTVFFPLVLSSVSIPHLLSTQPDIQHSNRLVSRSSSRCASQSVNDRPSPAKVILRFQPFSESSGLVMDQNGYKRQFEVGESDGCDE